uniref:MyTH4 domain-containing protein n=1 Tax=Labrus bergylta TaxID=56723 RepID=A0A3Q3LMY3_9LABR
GFHCQSCVFRGFLSTASLMEIWMRGSCRTVNMTCWMCPCTLVFYSDSCLRGWRLLYILTAFHRCSEVLKPFLLKYLQQASRSAGAQYQGIAKACEQNLKKTFQYGGRLVPPNSMELKAMMAGRSSKRQLFLFPGGIERHAKIKTCSVALEVIEELCYEMGLHRLEAMEEYAIFLVTNRGCGE